jgi:multidrug resistance efflux pump
VEVSVVEADLAVARSEVKKFEAWMVHLRPSSVRSTELVDADIKAARARLTEARAIEATYQTDVARWDAELNRLKHTIDSQVVPKSIEPSKTAATAREAVRAAIRKAEADLLSYRSMASKVKVEASVANATSAVAESEKTWIEEWVGRFAITAPYDGLIVARNASPLDFIPPSTGRPATARQPPQAPPRGAARHRFTWSTGSMWSGSSSTSRSRMRLSSGSGPRPAYASRPTATG